MDSQKVANNEVYRHVPLSTIEAILDALKAVFNEKTFTWSQALEQTHSHIGKSRTTLRHTFQYAVEKKRIYRIDKGKYSFTQPVGQCASLQNDTHLIDILFHTTDSRHLRHLFNFIAKSSESVLLSFSQSRIEIKSFGGDEITVLNAILEPKFLGAYSIREPIDFWIRTSDFVSCVKNVRDSEQMYLYLENGQKASSEDPHAIFLGAPGHEHQVSVVPARSEIDFPTISETWVQMTINSESLHRILRESRVHGSYVSLSFDALARKVVFEANNHSGKYRKALFFDDNSIGDLDLKTSCSGYFYIDALLRLFNYQDIQSQKITVALGKDQLLQMIVRSHEGFLLEYYVAPSTIDKEVEGQPVGAMASE